MQADSCLNLNASPTSVNLKPSNLMSCLGTYTVTFLVTGSIGTTGGGGGGGGATGNSTTPAPTTPFAYSFEIVVKHFAPYFNPPDPFDTLSLDLFINTNFNLKITYKMPDIIDIENH
jgi:hypothetical protein